MPCRDCNATYAAYGERCRNCHELKVQRDLRGIQETTKLGSEVYPVRVVPVAKRERSE